MSEEVFLVERVRELVDLIKRMDDNHECSSEVYDELEEVLCQCTKLRREKSVARIL